MEKIHYGSEASSYKPPKFYCETIAELRESREEIIGDIRNWYNNQASFLGRLTENMLLGSTQFPDLFPDLFKSPDHRITLAGIILANVRHYPIDDQNQNLPRNTICLRDSETDFLLVRTGKAEFHNAWGGVAYLQGVLSPDPNNDRYNLASTLTTRK